LTTDNRQNVPQLTTEGMETTTNGPSERL